jgi:hypothetical protein
VIDIDDNRKTAICSPKSFKNFIAKKDMDQYLKKESTGTVKLGDLFQLKNEKEKQ